jgi:hypothetical protein
MFRQMFWFSLKKTDKETVLYLQIDRYQRWKPDRNHSEYVTLDYTLPNFPK